MPPAAGRSAGRQMPPGGAARACVPPGAAAGDARRPGRRRRQGRRWRRSRGPAADDAARVCGRHRVGRVGGRAREEERDRRGRGRRPGGARAGRLARERERRTATATPITKIAIPRPGTNVGVRSRSIQATRGRAEDRHAEDRASPREPLARPPDRDQPAADERADRGRHHDHVVAVDRAGHEAEHDACDGQPEAPHQVGGAGEVRPLGHARGRRGPPTRPTTDSGRSQAIWPPISALKSRRMPGRAAEARRRRRRRRRRCRSPPKIRPRPS